MSDSEVLVDEEMKMNSMDENISESHSHYAGRLPVGSKFPVCISKNGIKHVREMDGRREEILSVGLACSECFSGPRLAKILQPGFVYEQQVLTNLIAGDQASPLSIHTSGGVPEVLSQFIQEMELHLPWGVSESHHWCMSLQMEGASAVSAAIDMLLQISMIESENTRRKLVAVGEKSYHGPPSTSFGSSCPMWNKDYQVKYPVPIAGEHIDEVKLLSGFKAFLDKHGDEVGVLLIEPQWGSSQAALPWPKHLIKAYISMAQEIGIKVICDEIMCGLGRHGHQTLFLSKAWGLNPDAVTFGKAIGGGVFPLSGAIVKNGTLLGEKGKTVLQSHTFAGSSVRAIMTAIEVLKELPKWFSSIAKLGDEMQFISGYLSKVSGGMLQMQGQGLMWGALVSRQGKNSDELFRKKTCAIFKQKCVDLGVLPYFVPAGGFMISPVIDIDVNTLYQMGERLEKAVKETMREIGWEVPQIRIQLSEVSSTMSSYTTNDYIMHDLPYGVMCPKRRMRFLDEETSFKRTEVLHE